MKKHLLPLFLCVIPFLLQAQEQKKVFYGVALVPGTAWGLDAEDAKQQLRPSANIDFTVGYHLNPRWSVSSGLSYASTGRKYEPVVPGADFIAEPFSDIPDILDEPWSGPGVPRGRTHSITQAYHFLAVPLRVTYQGHTDRSWRAYASVGLSPRFLLLHREKETKVYSDGNIKRSTRDHESEGLHLGLMLSGGIAFGLANGHQLFVGPNLQWVNVREQQYNQKDMRQLLQVGFEVGYRW